MAIISEVAITGPEGFHAKLEKAVEESGCYMDLSDYVRSRLRTFITMTELVSILLNGKDYALTSSEMFLSQYMKNLKTETKSRFSEFEGEKKTVYVTIPQPLY